MAGARNQNLEIGTRVGRTAAKLGTNAATSGAMGYVRGRFGGLGRLLNICLGIAGATVRTVVQPHRSPALHGLGDSLMSSATALEVGTMAEEIGQLHGAANDNEEIHEEAPAYEVDARAHYVAQEMIADEEVKAYA